MAPTWVAVVHDGPRRVNHAAVVVDTLMYSFGGHCSNTEIRPDDKMDIYVFGTTTLEWRKLTLKFKDEVNAPFMRYGHSAVTYNGKIIIWGGRKNDYTCNELFVFANQKWSKPQVKGTLPAGRDGHTACVVGNKMYVFGGFDDAYFCTGLYSLNLDTYTWSYEATKGTEPECRDFHAVTVIGNKFYLFGGRGTSDPPFHTERDTYPTDFFCFDTSTSTWTKLPYEENTPVGRRSLSMVAHEKNLYIFGGYNEELKMHFNDLHCYNTITEKWSEVKPFGTGPTPRRRHSCVIIKNRLFIYGGTAPRGAYRPLYGEDPDSNLLDRDDLFILDLRPSLRTLAMMASLNERVCLSSCALPLTLLTELRLHKKLAKNLKVLARQHFISTRGLRVRHVNHIVPYFDHPAWQQMGRRIMDHVELERFLEDFEPYQNIY